MASTGQPPLTTQSPGRREMMFCHECHDEWYRDERGIICPECDSEFTEVIEDNNDPRDHIMSSGEHDDDDSLPELEPALPTHHPLHDHNPWQDDDPDDSDISTMRFQPLGPNRFHVSATIHRTISPAALGQNNNGPNTIGGFSTFLSNLLQHPGTRRSDHPPSTGDRPGTPRPEESAEEGGPNVRHFTYAAGARLFPRDTNNPEPRDVPVDDISSFLSGLVAAFGEPPGARAGGPGHAHHTHGEMPMNPLMGLFAAMGHGGGQHGDFVYSQEALDRIISQLMEQTASGNAPGPAPQDAINSLPKKNITEEMLGAEGRAECSICMDEVNIGEEVTELPCKHWFHYACVSAWLTEHNTCPHCRKGITKSSENEENTTGSGNAGSSGTDPSFAMPGAFGSSGNPFTVPGAFPSTANTDNGNPDAAQNARSGTDGSSGSGFGERFRRARTRLRRRSRVASEAVERHPVVVYRVGRRPCAATATYAYRRGGGSF